MKMSGYSTCGQCCHSRLLDHGCFISPSVARLFPGTSAFHFHLEPDSTKNNTFLVDSRSLSFLANWRKLATPTYTHVDMHAFLPDWRATLRSRDPLGTVLSVLPMLEPSSERNHHNNTCTTASMVCETVCAVIHHCKELAIYTLSKNCCCQSVRRASSRSLQERT